MDQAGEDLPVPLVGEEADVDPQPAMLNRAGDALNAARQAAQHRQQGDELLLRGLAQGIGRYLAAQVASGTGGAKPDKGGVW
jgi:hypothetical protein